MPLAKDRTLSIGLNELSELTFEIPKYINHKEVAPYYEAIKTKRIVSLEDVGRFIITNVTTTTDGITEIKQVTCKGLEFELSNKNLDILEGTYALYNPSNQEKSLLHIVLKYASNWSISEVDSELWDIWRTFDIKDNNIYNFLMGEVQEAFDCVFIFDTFKRTIKVVKTSNLPKKTDIFLSNRNLMKELSIEENADNIVTALNVYGDGELSIHTVNPLGTATIYDFSYYTTPEWMSQGLIDAVKAWQSKVDNSKVTYANLLLQLKALNKELLILKQELVDLEIGKKEIEQKLGLAVVANDNSNCAIYRSQLEAKETQITNKNSQIKAKEKEIETTTTSLSNISKSLSFENNFTKEQWLELDNFIIQASIQNTNYSTTELTTVEEKQEIMSNLYSWAQDQLKKQSQPIWEFSIDSINFLNLIEYKDTASQLELGCEVVIEVDKEKDLYATAMLLGYSLNLDDFSDLELKFANVLRFNGSSYTFEELFNSTASISKSFDYESYTWDLGKNAYSMIDDYINNALDLTTQEIKASDNQEFTISNVGIRGMEYYPQTNTYSKEQIWINKNVIAFSDDAFNSTKTALGKITLPDGSKAYGLIGEYIVGKMLCGKTLVLENEKSTFRIDGEGVYIKDANIIMTSESGQELSIPDLIAKSTEKIDNVLTADGKLDTTKMHGQILAGTNNIFCVNSTNNKALLVNDTGILISNKKTSGNWVWTTAISADGISANAIQANGTLSGVNIVGGSLDIGSGAFTVDSSGNVGITKGTINMGSGAFQLDASGNIAITKGSISLGNGAFTVNSYGDIAITKGSININDGNFSVDSSGNVVAKSLTLTTNTKGEIDANNLKINNLVVGGNVTMGANATISWEKVTGKDSVATKDDLTWSNVSGKPDVATKDDLTWSNIGGKPTIPTIPSYIKSTYISSTEIKSPTITGTVVNSATFNGGVYRTWKDDYTVFGGQMDSNGLHVYNGSIRIGDFTYTNENTAGNPDALLIESRSGYAMKIRSSGNMSIDAGVGGKVYIGNAVFTGSVSGVTATFG